MPRTTELGTLTALVRGLDSWWPRQRQRAARALGASGDRGAVAPLLHALEDRRPAIRCEAAHSLGRLAAPEAFAGLARHARQDVDPGVRETSAAALALLGDARVAETLGQVLQDPERRVRAGAVDALAALGDSRAAIALIGGLVDPDLALRERVADLLAGTRDVRAVVEFIRGRCARMGEPRQSFGHAAAARARGGQVGPLLYAVSERDERTCRALVDALDAAGGALHQRVHRVGWNVRDAWLFEWLDDPRTVPALIEALRWTPRTRALDHAVPDAGRDALVRLGGERVAEPLVAALDGLIQANLNIETGDARHLFSVDHVHVVREPAASVLLRCGPPAVRALLGRQESRDVPLREAILTLLLRFDDAVVVDTLLGALREEDKVTIHRFRAFADDQARVHRRVVGAWDRTMASGTRGGAELADELRARLSIRKAGCVSGRRRRWRGHSVWMPATG